MARYFTDKDGVVYGGLNAKGQEVVDPNPVAVPTGLGRSETLSEQIRRLIRTLLSEQAGADGEETFEEADDFDVGDDFDPTTPYEMNFDPVLQREVSPEMVVKNKDKYDQMTEQRLAPKKAKGSKKAEPNSAPITPREAEPSSPQSGEADPD